MTAHDQPEHPLLFTVTVSTPSTDIQQLSPSVSESSIRPIREPTRSSLLVFTSGSGTPSTSAITHPRNLFADSPQSVLSAILNASSDSEPLCTTDDDDLIVFKLPVYCI